LEREKIGKISTDLLVKPEITNPIDQAYECLTEYDKNIFECIDAHKGTYKGNFYIVVLTKKERLMQNVIRNYFMARSTCPSPDFDQVVYHYNALDESIEFLWVLPSKDTCEYLKFHMLLLPSEQKELLGFVLSFYDGSLTKLCKKLNGELHDSLILEKE
jgi:hypothetical protein